MPPRTAVKVGVHLNDLISRVTYQDTVKGSPKRKRVESIPNDTDLLVTDEEVNDAGYGGKEKKGERLSFTEPQVTAEGESSSDEEMEETGLPQEEAAPKSKPPKLSKKNKAEKNPAGSKRP